MFYWITIRFGAALIALSGLAAAAGAVTVGTAIIPALLGGSLILLAWFDRRITVQQGRRQWSPTRFPIIAAAVLVFFSAHGVTQVLDALSTGTSPSASGIFLFGMAAAGVGYIIFAIWLEIAEIRRIARARAAAPPARRARSSRR